MDLQTAMTPPNEHCDCNECEAARVCAAEIHRLCAEVERLRAIAKEAREQYAWIVEDEAANRPTLDFMQREIARIDEALRGGGV